MFFVYKGIEICVCFIHLNIYKKFFTSRCIKSFKMVTIIVNRNFNFSQNKEIRVVFVCINDYHFLRLDAKKEWINYLEKQY